MKTIWQFQFHNGSIKRPLQHHIVNLAPPFQFHNGSIKSRHLSEHNTHIDRVSIPQWFD